MTFTVRGNNRRAYTMQRRNSQGDQSVCPLSPYINDALALPPTQGSYHSHALALFRFERKITDRGDSLRPAIGLYVAIAHQHIHRGRVEYTYICSLSTF